MPGDRSRAPPGRFPLAQGIEGFGAGAVDLSRDYLSLPNHVLSGNPRLPGYFARFIQLALHDRAGSQTGCSFACQSNQPLARCQMARFAEAPGCAGGIAHRQQDDSQVDVSAKIFPRISWVGVISCRACSAIWRAFPQVAGCQINFPQVHQVICQRRRAPRASAIVRACSIIGRACLYNPIV